MSQRLISCHTAMLRNHCTASVTSAHHLRRSKYVRGLRQFSARRWQHVEMVVLACTAVSVCLYFVGSNRSLYVVSTRPEHLPGTTRKLSYRKDDDRAMRPIYGCTEKFESPHYAPDYFSRNL